ncbi:cytochrome c [Olivibacter sp. LS-1]|jgi:hypothetical protein|uniref:c-type cytochrome n=1 Tax=Olivibacter sp. LS-1 TaxID=2592345 RepID=UPI0011EA8691|nr:cytochrome c [Olivibacter sp. LS-1]QEL02619.1 cytochrome c [Olivibacter sp. LS-1]
MDFPMFHLDWLNDRFLIAMIAIIHVLINHGLAVGFYPLVVWFEYQSVKHGSSGEIVNRSWDKLAYRLMFVVFIITTTIGAMTGVGIWFSAGLVSPSSIGSLIRVFYWAWFTEWLVFLTEVVLIVIYTLTWKNSNKTIAAKMRHIRFGGWLCVFSWITMAIIVAILGFMMDPGNWNAEKSLLNGINNPIYIPQLAFRTPVAMLVGGMLSFFLTFLFTKKDTTIRLKATKYLSIWLIAWTPLALGASYWYHRVLPTAMKANLSTAVTTMEFEKYYDLLIYFIAGGIGSGLLVAIIGLWKPRVIRAYMLILPLLVSFAFLGIFERVREFIRKPYVIGGYMYSNLLRQEDYPLYRRDGILKHATYTSVTEITAENKLLAGRDVFMLSCSRCHTAHGVNSITEVFENMYGKDKPLDETSMKAYIPVMHHGRSYMPPYPGNEEELDALVAYIANLQETGETLEGAQTTGVIINPRQNAVSAAKLLQQKQLADGKEAKITNSKKQ